MRANQQARQDAKSAERQSSQEIVATTSHVGESSPETHVVFADGDQLLSLTVNANDSLYQEGTETENEEESEPSNEFLSNHSDQEGDGSQSYPTESIRENSVPEP